MDAAHKLSSGPGKKAATKSHGSTALFDAVDYAFLLAYFVGSRFLSAVASAA